MIIQARIARGELRWLASLGWAALDRYDEQLTKGHRRVDEE